MKKLIIKSKRHGAREVLLDDEDFIFVSHWRWHVLKTKNTFYACRIIDIDGKKVAILIHRFIMGVTERLRWVDHRDHDGLNCQKYNLRECSPGENLRNGTSRKGASSKYLGVGWHKIEMRWHSRITNNGKVHHIGSFLLEEDAAKAYDAAAKNFHGEFANLNFG